MCYPIFMQGIICENNIPQLPRCNVVDIQQSSFPEPNFHRIYEVRPFILRLHDELIFFLGGGILSSSTKRKALYTPLYLVRAIVVCSVVGRIAAMLLYVLLDQY